MWGFMRPGRSQTHLSQSLLDVCQLAECSKFDENCDWQEKALGSSHSIYFPSGSVPFTGFPNRLFHIDFSKSTKFQQSLRGVISPFAKKWSQSKSRASSVINSFPPSPGLNAGAGKENCTFSPPSGAHSDGKEGPQSQGGDAGWSDVALV